nr:unnamed protein product [Callosobruchus chinensis]
MYCIPPVHFFHIHLFIQVNTTYNLKFTLSENNNHFKSIDVPNSSSPLFTALIWLITLSLLRYSCGKPYTLALATF